MVVYQTIAALVNQIPVDTWDVLREIKERRPAIMLSELINCRTQASQPSERRNQNRQGSGSLEMLNPGTKSWGSYEWLRQAAEALKEQRDRSLAESIGSGE